MTTSNPLEIFNLTVRFLLELGGLAGLAYWGFHTGASWPAKLLLGIGVPLLAAVLWGVFRVDGDPGQAPVRVAGPLRLVLEALFFGSATAGLWAAGRPGWAVGFGAVVLINYAMMFQRLTWLWRQ